MTNVIRATAGMGGKLYVEEPLQAGDSHQVDVVFDLPVNIVHLSLGVNGEDSGLVTTLTAIDYEGVETQVNWPAFNSTILASRFKINTKKFFGSGSVNLRYYLVGGYLPAGL